MLEPGRVHLRRFRETLGLTLAEMAGELGMNTSYLCQLEMGVNPIGHKSAMRLLKKFRRELRGAGITLEDLLRVSEEAEV